MKKKSHEISDLQTCKQKIQVLLKEYNCSLLDFEEGSWVLLYDKDTKEVLNVNEE